MEPGQQLTIALAAFGVTYAILDSKLLEPVRETFWPEAHCYFCVGFWVGLVLAVGWLLLQPQYYEPKLMAFDLAVTAFMSCGVVGWLATQMTVYVDEREEETDASDIDQRSNDLRPGRGEGGE